MDELWTKMSKIQVLLFGCTALYIYLEIDFTESGAWDMHMKKVVDTGKKKVNQLQSVISNRDINLSACRLFLLVVVRLTSGLGS